MIDIIILLVYIYIHKNRYLPNFLKFCPTITANINFILEKLSLMSASSSEFAASQFLLKIICGSGVGDLCLLYGDLDLERLSSLLLLERARALSIVGLL